MDFRSVLVECIYHGGNLPGSSGIMVNNGHVITTLTTITPFLTKSDYRNIARKQADHPIELDLRDNLQNVSFFIYYKDDDSSTRSRKAFLLNYLFSDKIAQSTKNIFHNWSIDYPDNNKNFHLMSLFVILKLDGSKNNFQDDIHQWFEKLPRATFTKGQHLTCMSAAFGNQNFLNHCNVGILSNISGINYCLIFSDLPLTPGSEGSPVYCDSSWPYPMGIVISVVNWWKNECLNFTVIADLGQVLQEIVKTGESMFIECDATVNNTPSKLLDAVELTLFQIYSGTIWGTAILIEKDKGIFITNAHVVDSNNEIIIYVNNKAVFCDLIYSSPENHFLDIAILKAKAKLKMPYKAASFSKKKLGCGQLVYAAGFPIFSKETNMGPTITEGYISHVHPHIIKTTCSVYPGASGGAVLDQEGGLVAIIVCNAKITHPINRTYPNFNMNIPISLLEPILENYMNSGDSNYLSQISLIDVSVWNCFSKL